MANESSSLGRFSPAELARARQWVAAWKEAGPELERIRRQELRQLDAFAAIALLSGPADYRTALRAPKPTSGLVEQQAWFQKTRGR